MSLAKVTHVARAAKPAGPCTFSSCSVVIGKGDPYQWWKVGFRSHHKHVRCVDHPPRQSERESSKIASVYAAQESFEDGLDQLTEVEEIVDALQEVADAMREVASEYEESSTDDNGTVFNQDAADRAETLEASADELESWSPSDDEPNTCEEHEDEGDTVEDCADCVELRDEWIDGVREEARSAVNDAELP